MKNGGRRRAVQTCRTSITNYGPYPLSLSAIPQKVVDEDSKVTLFTPNNPVFNWPNKITTADFDGWVEERGHGFMSTWDSHYIALVEMHDAEQDPQKGGLFSHATARAPTSTTPSRSIASCPSACPARIV